MQQHSWGLHHEHQNPKWWEEKFTQVERDNWFFSEDNFHCENLADFERAMTGIPRQPEYLWKEYRNKICRNRLQAIRGQFAGGLNYLPVDESGMVDDGKDAPDWDSIMLCKFPLLESRIPAVWSIELRAVNTVCARS